VNTRARADAHREELHQLAREVLLRPAANIEAPVEPDQHRRVPGDLEQQIAEVSDREFPEQLDLADDAVGVLAGLGGEHAGGFRRSEGAVDFRVGGGEVVVPEERHLLLERALAMDHPEQPALARVVDVRQRLKAPGGTRGDADVPRLADLAVDVVRCAVEGEQALDGRDERHRRIARDVVFNRSERGPPQQMLDVLFASPGHGLSLPDTGRRRGWGRHFIPGC
jgi:hypothetical protein